MQATKADNTNSQSREGEKCMNFRPSPNFKHMKKYLKSKFEETAGSSTQNAAVFSPPPTPISTFNSPSPYAYASEHDKIKHIVQPPLPPNPPPPDSPPPPPPLLLKKEVEDVEYQESGEVVGSLNSLYNTLNKDSTPNEQPEEKPAERQICRDFVRGECARPGTCKYIHEVDVKKLDGVYTFCRNYQNSGCSRLNCKYVHATVFEKENFYRTGYLPPHVLTHHKLQHQKGKLLLPPPPPPPPEDPTPLVQIPPVFTTPPPIIPPCVPVTPTISCVPSTSFEPIRVDEDYRHNISTSAAAIKRKWSSIEQLGSSSFDFRPNEEVPKKCKNCDIMDFRIQYFKNKAEEVTRATEDKKKKLAILSKRYNKLFSVLTALVKATHPNTPSSLLNIPSPLHMSNEKEKSLLEQVEALISANTRNNN